MLPDKNRDYILFALILAGYVTSATLVLCLRRLQAASRPAARVGYVVHIQRRVKPQPLSNEALDFLSQVAKDL